MGLKTMLRDWLFDQPPAGETVEQMFKRMFGPSPGQVRSEAVAEMAQLRTELDFFAMQNNLRGGFTPEQHEWEEARLKKQADRAEIEAIVAKRVSEEFSRDAWKAYFSDLACLATTEGTPASPSPSSAPCQCRRVPNGPPTPPQSADSTPPEAPPGPGAYP